MSFNKFRNILLASTLVPLMVLSPLSADDHADDAVALLGDLIAFQTTNGGQDIKKAADYLGQKFIEAGILSADVKRVDHNEALSSLVVRYRGKDSSLKPILVMAHLDVVPAERSDWSMEPFELTEKDGILYGRGVMDNKAGIATTAATIMRFAREGYVPDRDIILAFTGDEETNADAIKDLIKNHRDLIDAEYALNSDAGGGALTEELPTSYTLQASEKIYQDFALTVTNSGGHSSVPRSDNAIYDLVNGLQRLSRYQFPVMLNPVSAGYFREMAKTITGPSATAMRKIALDPTDEVSEKILVKASPYYNAVMRTTCTTTMLDAGHAANALPQTAKAVVNCRIVPSQTPQQIEDVLTTIIASPSIEITRLNEAFASEPSPLRPDVLKALNETLFDVWGSVAVIPNMSTGATDGQYLRNAGIPVYGVGGIFADETGSNSHGRDEHIRRDSFNKALDHWDGLLKRLTGGKN